MALENFSVPQFPHLGKRVAGIKCNSLCIIHSTLLGILWTSQNGSFCKLCYVEDEEGPEEENKSFFTFVSLHHLLIPFFKNTN